MMAEIKGKSAISANEQQGKRRMQAHNQNNNNQTQPKKPKKT